ncbi:MAG: hypothetical protein HY319_20330 [Armatimonadetes bacterium]|nr:hypothetical protein [Armatimonadota bacterium]
MRILMLLATIALVLGVFHRCRSAERTAVIPPESLLMLPEMTELKAVRLQRELLPIMERMEKAHRQVQGSPSPENQELARQAEQEYEKALSRLLEPDQLRRAAAIPSGEAGRRRYLEQLPQSTMGLSGAQKESLQRLSRALEAVPEGERQRVFDGRYWQMVALLLNPEQVRELRTRLPGRMVSFHGPDELLRLPGLTSAQANQLVSLFRNVESETIPDRTRAEQIEAELPRLAGPERAPLQQEMLGIQLGLLERREQLQQDVAAILDAEQKLVLETLPPAAGGGQLPELAEQLVSGVGWSAEQRQRLEPQLRLLHEQAEKLQPEVQAMMEQAEDMTPEEPGGMAAMLAVREKIEPIERLRLELARRFAATMTEAQMEAFLRGTLPPEPAAMHRIHSKAQQVQSQVHLWETRGRDLSPVAPEMHRFEELLQGGQVEEAEQQLDRVLEILSEKADS